MFFTQADIDSVRLQVSVRRLRRLCASASRVEVSQFIRFIEHAISLRRLIPALCCTLLERECFDEAVDTLGTLLNEHAVRRHRELTDYLHHALAAVHRQQGNFALAVIHQQSAGRALFVSSGPSEPLCSAARSSHASDVPLLSRADLLSAWGQDALIEGQFVLARQYFSQAIYWEQQEQNLNGEADDWGNLGLLEGLAGNPRQGIRYLWKAYHFHLRCCDQSAQVHDLMNLAILYERIDRMKFSMALVRRATAVLGTTSLPETSRTLKSLTRRMRQLNVLQYAVAIHN